MMVFKMRDSVPSTRYSSVCNVLRQWNISLIPTYRVYDSMIHIRIKKSNSKTILFKVNTSSIYLIVPLNFIDDCKLSLTRFFMYPYIYIYTHNRKKNRFVSNGARSVPIRIPICCLNTLLPTLI